MLGLDVSVLGLDEDWSKVDPTIAYRDGFRFAIGYVSQDITGKNLTPADVQRLHSAGLAIGLVYEYATTSPLGGAAQGRVDAQIAISGARTLNAPPGVAIYAAVDFNVTENQMPTVMQYLMMFDQYCKQAGFRSGAYGSYLMCQWLSTHGYPGFLWQTYAWSNGQWSSATVIRQVHNGVHEAGATVDQDEAEAFDWGQWTMTDPTLVAVNKMVAGIASLAPTVNFPNPDNGIPGDFTITLSTKIQDISDRVTALENGVFLSDADRQLMTDFVNAVTSLRKGLGTS